VAFGGGKLVLVLIVAVTAVLGELGALFCLVYLAICIMLPKQLRVHWYNMGSHVRSLELRASWLVGRWSPGWIHQNPLLPGESLGCIGSGFSFCLGPGCRICHRRLGMWWWQCIGGPVNKQGDQEQGNQNDFGGGDDAVAIRD